MKGLIKQMDLFRAKKIVGVIYLVIFWVIFFSAETALARRLKYISEPYQGKTLNHIGEIYDLQGRSINEETMSRIRALLPLNRISEVLGIPLSGLQVQAPVWSERNISVSLYCISGRSSTKIASFSVKMTSSIEIEYYRGGENDPELYPEFNVEEIRSLSTLKTTYEETDSSRGRIKRIYYNLREMPVINLYVNPAMRRNRIGMLLYSECLEPYLNGVCGFDVIAVSGSCLDEGNGAEEFWKEQGFNNFIILNPVDKAAEAIRYMYIKYPGKEGN